MSNIIADIQYVEVNNCFLHLSSTIHSRLGYLQSRCLRGLIVKSQKVIYLTVSPEVCRILPEDSVGVSPVYASSLSLIPGDNVILTPLSLTPSLSKVVTYPLSDDDREILEISSVEVESSLLNQLHVVWPNQCFPIWISNSVSVKLIVDSIHPEVEYGRLEEKTELVIGDAKKPSKLITTGDKSSEHVNISSEETVNDDNYGLNETAIEKLVCRLTPQGDDQSGPPYLVNLSSEWCPQWLKSSDASTVFKLLGSNEPYSTVYVNVDILPYQNVDIGSFKALSASQTVINQLALTFGSKVLLTCPHEPHEQLNSLLLTPCPLLKKKYSFSDMENIFRKKLSVTCVKWGRCLLNTKARFPLDNGLSVYVTLRPLNLKWAFVTLISLQNLPISVNTFETINTLAESKVSHLDDQQSVFVGPVFTSMVSLAEHSLALKSGLTDRCSFNNNFLLVGKHGSGKTHVSNYFLTTIARFPYHIHFEKIDCTSLKGKRIESLGKIFSSYLNSCQNKCPSVLLIEHIDVICGTFSPELEKTEASFHTQRVSQKVANLLESYASELPVLVFATTASISSINPFLFNRRGKSVFSSVLKIQPLNQEERKELLKCMVLNKTSNSKNSLQELNIEYYSSLTESYVAGDLVRFIEKALFEASQRQNTKFKDQPILTEEDLEKAFKSSSALINHKLKVQKSQDVKLSDVGGLKSIKEKLIEIIVWPSKYGSLLNQCPLRKQTGVLLYGAPGSGKTLIARAIAQESNLNFITVKGPELMSKYIGESEEGVRRVFENAQSAKPSLLFFDEFESLAPRRGEEQTGVTDRVVNQLLTALDGVEPISGVIVVAASSRPDLIDPALLRPGRLSHHLFCSFPSVDERLEILEKLTRSIILNDDVDLYDISKRTIDFSGADLKGLLMTTQIQVLDNIVDLKTDMNDSEMKFVSEEVKREVTISQADLLDALEQTKPSLSMKEKFHYASIYKVFGGGKVPDVLEQRAIFA